MAGDDEEKREYLLEDYESSGMAKPQIIDFKGHRSGRNEKMLSFDMCGKNLLLPQERKLIGKVNHIEICLVYDGRYSLFTTSPRIIIS